MNVGYMEQTTYFDQKIGTNYTPNIIITSFWFTTSNYGFNELQPDRGVTTESEFDIHLRGGSTPELLIIPHRYVCIVVLKTMLYPVKPHEILRYKLSAIGEIRRMTFYRGNLEYKKFPYYGDTGADDQI